MNIILANPGKIYCSKLLKVIAQSKIKINEVLFKILSCFVIVLGDISHLVNKKMDLSDSE